MIDWSKIPSPTHNPEIIKKQFEETRAALLLWLEQYGYCAYGTFSEFDALLDKFKEDIEKAEIIDT